MPLDQAGIVGVLKHIHLFQNIEDQKLEAAAALFEDVERVQEDVIFQQGEAPDYFYIIVSGQVRLTCRPYIDQPTGELGILEDDDYFGEEVLESGWPRQATARAASDVTLLRISIPNFIQILEIINSKTFESALQMILDSYRLKLRTHLNWLEKDESVIFIARRHLIILFEMLFWPTLTAVITIPLAAVFYVSTQLFIALALLGAVVLASLAWWVWCYIDWTNDYYVVTTNRIVFQERVVLLYESRQESPLSALQSTNINTSQWGRWLGYGNVAVRTFYGTILFRDIARPSHVMLLIQQNQLRAQFSQRRQDIKKIKGYITQRLHQGPERPSFQTARKSAPKPDPTREFVSTMFHLRYENGGTIIYRTHWFLLIQKTFIPGLLLFVLLTFFIYSASTQFAMLSVGATCSLLFVVGAIVLGWWFYQYMDWHNDLYLITSDQVIDVYKKPLGQEERQAAPIKNIQSIEYKRLGIIGLFLNFGTVYIRVGDKQLTFDDVYRPADVQRELFHALQKAQAKEKEQQAEGDKRRLGDWFDSFQQWARENQSEGDIKRGF